MKLAKRALILEPSPTLSLNALVLTLISDGHKIINLTSGQLDFPTPENIKQAGIAAIKNNKTFYTPTAGIPQLREQIAKKFTYQNKIETKADNVVVGVGAKPLLYNAFQVLCNPGDEVLLAVPTWTSYVEQIRLAEAKPVLIETPAPFILTAELLKKHITKKSKIILLNSPSNPTGAVIPKEELQKIGELAVEKDLYIITDEIYECMVFDSAEHHSIAALSKEIAERTITINGFSKAYSMTGWRVGYATGPKEVIEQMVAFQSQTTSNTCSIAQYAALEALEGPDESIAIVQAEIDKRRSYLIKELSQIKGLTFEKPSGSFYFFVSIEKLLNEKYPTSDEWCKQLLAEQKVAVVPGEAFLAPGYFRLSFAASMAELKVAVKRIKSFVE